MRKLNKTAFVRGYSNTGTAREGW